MHFGSDQLAQYGKTVLHKKDGSTIEPNKDRPTSLDIAKICAAYECNEVFLFYNFQHFNQIGHKRCRHRLDMGWKNVHSADKKIF